ncbi:MAG: hypothetical protein V4592_03800 [Bacteroidota bacterium]
MIKMICYDRHGITYGWFLIIVTLIGCNSPGSVKTVADSLKHAKIVPDTAEYIDDIKLNGAIRVKTDLKSVVTELGQPDSTLMLSDQKSADGQFNKNITYYYFKGIEFEKDRDTMALLQIDFRRSPGAYLQTPRFKLSSNTTISDVEKYFPNAVDNELRGTDMDLYMAIAVPIKGTKAMWFLYLDRKTEKLYRISYIVPD